MPGPKRRVIPNSISKRQHKEALKKSQEARKRIDEMLRKKKKPWDVGSVEGNPGDMTKTKTRLKR